MERMNDELYRDAGMARARREWKRTEAKKMAAFALIWAIAFVCFGEILRVFFQAEALAMTLAPCWVFLVLGCWIGRSGLRHELYKEWLQ